MLRKFLIVFIFVFVAIQLSQNISYAGPGKQRLDDFIKHLIDYSKGNKSAQSSIEGILDIDFMAKRAMNLHWKKMSASQKKEYLSVFKKLLRHLAYKKSGEYFTSNKYKIGNEMEDNIRDYLTSKKKERLDVITVTMKVDYKAKTGVKKETITFHFIKQDGKLIVFDVELLEGSLVKDYRNQFSKTIREEGGVDGLIKKLNKRYKEEMSK